MFHKMQGMNPSPEKEDSVFVSPKNLAYLSNNSVAHELIHALRWDVAPICPRCQSKYTKQVNTNVFRQLYRCIDCTYMFNSLAGTIFHGSKMPVTKYLQFFVLHNALQTQLPLRDLGYALDVSHKTASLLMKRVNNVSYSFQFAKVDKKGSHLRPNPADQDDDQENAPFFSYCNIKSITVADAPFKKFLQQLMREELEAPSTLGIWAQVSRLIWAKPTSQAAPRWCPRRWCSFGDCRAFRLEPGTDQFAAAGKLMSGSSLIEAIVSRVM